MCPRSPVVSHPSRKGCVASSSAYPIVTCGPRARISPSIGDVHGGFREGLAHRSHPVAPPPVQRQERRLGHPVRVVHLDAELVEALEQTLRHRGRPDEQLSTPIQPRRSEHAPANRPAQCAFRDPVPHRQEPRAGPAALDALPDLL